MYEESTYRISDKMAIRNANARYNWNGWWHRSAAIQYNDALSSFYD